MYCMTINYENIIKRLVDCFDNLSPNQSNIFDLSAKKCKHEITLKSFHNCKRHLKWFSRELIDQNRMITLTDT